MKLKSVLQVLAVNLVILFTLIIISELLVRLFNPSIQPQTTSRNLWADNRYYDTYGLKPKSKGKSNGVEVRVNELGFRRSKKDINKKDKGWLLLGDSVTMGVGVNEDSTYAGKLHNNCRDYNVYNSAVFGYSYYDYLNIIKYFIEEEKLDLNIDHVTLFFCLNDINHSGANICQSGGKIRLVFGNIFRILGQYSRMYLFLKDNFADRPKAYYLYDEQYYSMKNVEYEKCIQALKYLNQVLNERNIRFEIVILPYEYQLRENYQPAQIVPQKLLIDELKTSEIEIYDAFAYFKKWNGKTNDLYLYVDGIHFSDVGHDLVYKYVKKQGICTF